MHPISGVTVPLFSKDGLQTQMSESRNNSSDAPYFMRTGPVHKRGFRCYTLIRKRGGALLHSHPQTWGLLLHFHPQTWAPLLHVTLIRKRGGRCFTLIHKRVVRVYTIIHKRGVSCYTLIHKRWVRCCSLHSHPQTWGPL